ncbi:MAG: BatD family protein [Pirellulales bacterium]|nr:BatD family protein [Pirellulales bacterium]
MSIQHCPINWIACNEWPRAGMFAMFGFVVSCLLSPLAGSLAAQKEAPEVLVKTSHQRVYEGQSILYSVTLNHVENPSAPEMSGLEDFDVQFLGEQSLDSTSITIINGRMTQNIRRGREYRYRLTPRKTGRLTIPGPVVTVDGQSLVGQEQFLEVIPADQQDVVVMDLRVDPPNLYPMQPFTVTLTVAIKSLPAPFEAKSPLGFDEAPRLHIPWAADEELPDGLEPQMNWQDWLGPMQSSARDGFNVNDIGRNSISFFFEDRLSRFKPQPVQVQLPDKDGKQTNYWKYEFPRTFIAKKTGTFRFGPVTLQGAFGTKLNSRNQVIGEEIYAVAQPIEVPIQDVPPPSGDEAMLYTGAIGRFQWNGNLEPKQAKVGDPMTLTLTLIGDGTLQSISAPDLKQIPEIADHFIIYEATVETNRKRCQFTYGLRPIDETISVFPGVSIVYFDVDQEQYATLRTDPIPIQVAKADRRSEDQIVSGQRGSSSRNHRLESRREGIVANITDPKEIRDESIHPTWWLAGLGSLLGAYAVVALVTDQVRRVAGDTALLRRRGAAGKARRRMRDALAQLAQNRTLDGADQLRNAFCGLVADVQNVPEAGLTPKDARQALETMGLDPDLALRFSNLLEKCDAAQYGAMDHDLKPFATEAKALLEETIRQLKAWKGP